MIGSPDRQLNTGAVGLILAFTMKEGNLTTFQVDAEGRIILNQGGDQPSAVHITSGSGNLEERIVDDTDAWYKQTEK